VSTVMETSAAAFDDLYNALGIPGIARSVLEGFLGFGRARRLCASVCAPCPDQTRFVAERLLEKLQVRYRVADSDLEQIPRSGPLIVIANHPFGILEGAVLAALLNRIRPDVRFLGNRILSIVPDVGELVIPVDTGGGSPAAHANTAALRRSLNHLKSGGCLAVFPAGEVSHFQIDERTVTDSPWTSAVSRIVSRLAGQGTCLNVVPIFVGGSNSLVFQTLGLMSPKLRTAMLVRELLNKKNKTVEIRIGSPIPARRLLAFPTHAERTGYLRWRTYLLAARTSFKPRTSRPLTTTRRGHVSEHAAAIEPSLLAAEIGAMGSDRVLARTGNLEVYVAPASLIPNVLQEIGRLREITFRAAGEGTGRAADLDRFDPEYLHLFVWNPNRSEIVGAYRFAATDSVSDLYTASLFRFDPQFLNRIGPALELGRSFVRAEYQKSFAPLLALWKGIGAWIARHPRYKVLFGAVSISNQYQAISRELMVAFLERRAPLGELMGLVSSRLPFQTRSTRFPRIAIDVEDVSEAVADLEPDRSGIPVLLRQYLKLGGRLLGFNVDPEFSDALDGLILVDLTLTEPRLLDRYLGKDSVAEFLKYWHSRKSDRMASIEAR
jgi:putative hemolysin